MKNKDIRLRRWAIAGAIANLIFIVLFERFYITISSRTSGIDGFVIFWVIALILWDLMTLVPLIIYIKKSYKK